MADGIDVDREALAREVWANDELGTGTDPLPTHQQEEVKPKEQEAAKPAVAEEVDPWAGVAPALREQFDGLRAKLEHSESLEMRLKQAERRLGSVQGELHAAKEAAKAVPVAPSPEQAAAAEQTKREWDDFASTFPEMAGATEKRLAAEMEKMRQLVPDQAVVRRQISEELQSYKSEVAGQFVAMRHPDWMELRDSADFQAWNKEQGERNSENPLEVIQILDDYKQFKASQKTPKQIEAERQQRLEQAQVTEGRSMKPPKSADDMSPAELRAAIAKQVWQ